MDNDNRKRTILKWWKSSITLPGTTFVSRCVGISILLLALAVVIWVTGAALPPVLAGLT